MNEWYGNARSARQFPRSANGQRTLQAVGGTLHDVRAIYGSLDEAAEDHTNDTLCKLAPASAHFTDNPIYTGPTYPHNVHRYAAHETSAHSTPTLEPLSIDFYLRRAAKHSMTIADYCAMLNIPI